jgi:hypothetical protein
MKYFFDINFFPIQIRKLQINLQNKLLPSWSMTFVKTVKFEEKWTEYDLCHLSYIIFIIIMLLLHAWMLQMTWGGIYGGVGGLVEDLFGEGREKGIHTFQQFYVLPGKYWQNF